MQTGGTDSPLDDVEYLARSEHRATALAALSRRPQSRADLLEMTGVSQSTIGRTIREFEKRNWITRDGKHYEATQLGAFVAAGMEKLVDRVATDQTLRDVWALLPGESSGFDIEAWDDAVVTVADATDPYRPASRFESLVRETDHFCFAGFEVALLELCCEDLCRQIRDGMTAELIDPPSVVQYIRTSYPERFERTLESDNLTIRLHDDLPHYGVGIFDERVAISGYDPDSGTAQVLLDTDGAPARDWAESVFESYRRENPTVALGPGSE